MLISLPAAGSWTEAGLPGFVICISVVFLGVPSTLLLPQTYPSPSLSLALSPFPLLPHLPPLLPNYYLSLLAPNLSLLPFTPYLSHLIPLFTSNPRPSTSTFFTTPPSVPNLSLHSASIPALRCGVITNLKVKHKKNCFRRGGKTKISGIKNFTQEYVREEGLRVIYLASRIGSERILPLWFQDGCCLRCSQRAPIL